MKVLLDENLPRKLVNALRSEGHEAESVHTLHQVQDEFVKVFIAHFRTTDWADYDHCADWPRP